MGYNLYFKEQEKMPNTAALARRNDILEKQELSLAYSCCL